MLNILEFSRFVRFYIHKYCVDRVVYVQSDLTYTHTSTLDELRIKQGNWINEGAVV